MCCKDAQIETSDFPLKRFLVRVGDNYKSISIPSPNVPHLTQCNFFAHRARLLFSKICSLDCCGGCGEKGRNLTSELGKSGRKHSPKLTVRPWKYPKRKLIWTNYQFSNVTFREEIYSCPRKTAILNWYPQIQLAHLTVMFFCIAWPKSFTAPSIGKPGWRLDWRSISRYQVRWIIRRKTNKHLIFMLIDIDSMDKKLCFASVCILFLGFNNYSKRPASRIPPGSLWNNDE